MQGIGVPNLPTSMLLKGQLYIELSGLIMTLQCPVGEGSGNPIQYSSLGNPKDRGALWATVCGVTESDIIECTHTHTVFYWTCVCVCVCVSRSVMSNSATPWTVAHQAPLSMGFFSSYWTYMLYFLYLCGF